MDEKDARTPKQRRFAEEYLLDLNATQAAIRVGYSAVSVPDSGYENLRKSGIASEIAKLRKAQSERTGVTADQVILELRRAGQAALAIAMEDGSPFGLAGLWENWKNPNTGEWERTFAIITVLSNELVGQIHDRMPAILEHVGYDRWLGLEPDPHDLLITYPSEPMTMWPISARVNKPENDDPSLLDRTADPTLRTGPIRNEISKGEKRQSRRSP